AEKQGVGVDIHLHDRHEAGTTTIKVIIRLTKEYGLQDKVFISHAFGLNDFIGEERDEVYDPLAAEKIHINSSVPITPNTNPPIMELLRHGVNVHLGCDKIY
ncbi:amidohydrolase family protein, partial [Enterococcus faecalis]|uniref:amidohydrolase family protein n=1 Tax=Enterococcus faecalis TaxID=1351 RepID=UPI003CC6267E